MSRNRFGASAAKIRPTRSSCTGDPDRPFFEPRFLPKTLHHLLAVHLVARVSVDDGTERMAEVRRVSDPDVFHLSTSAAMYSSAMEEWTRCRPVAMRIWPWCRKLSQAPIDAAA